MKFKYYTFIITLLTKIMDYSEKKRGEYTLKALKSYKEKKHSKEV